MSLLPQGYTQPKPFQGRAGIHVQITISCTTRRIGHSGHGAANDATDSANTVGFRISIVLRERTYPLVLPQENVSAAYDEADTMD